MALLLLPRRFCAAFCGYAPEALQRWSSQVDFKLQLWSRVVLMCKWRAVLNFLLLLQSFVFYKRIDQGKRTRVLKKVFLSSFFASLQKTTTTAVVSTLVFFLQFSYFGTASSPACCLIFKREHRSRFYRSILFFFIHHLSTFSIFSKFPFCPIFNFAHLLILSNFVHFFILSNTLRPR